MFRWLLTSATPSAFDATLALVGGGGCAAIAAVNAAHGYWWPAALFALVSAGPLRSAQQYFRSRDA